MPDVRSGIESGEGELDVNSDAGFQAALARQTGGEISREALQGLEERDTTILKGLTTEESAPAKPRDEHGRFTSAAVPEEEPEGVASTESGEGEEEPVDPAVADFLSRHGGDAQTALSAALREAQEAQRLVGRHANEVGEHRAREQELAERLARLEGQMQAQGQSPTAPIPVVSDDEVAGLERLYEAQGGPGMIRWLVDNNRGDLHDEAVAVWAADDPIAANAYNTKRIVYEQMHQFQGAPVSQQPDERVESLIRERQLGAAVATTRASLGEQEWNLVKDHLTPTLQDEGTPQVIRDMVIHGSVKPDTLPGDPETQAQGFRLLAQVARQRAVASATEKATTGQEAAHQEMVRGATVASGSLHPKERQPKGDTSPTDRAEAVKKFHAALLGTETTDVHAGLTFGNK